MSNVRPPRLVLEGATILPGGFRNFAGAGSRYNREGDRFFNVRIPQELVESLKAAGWNVKTRESRDGFDEEALHYLKVRVKYGQYPPKVALVTGRKKTYLEEQDLISLDYANIKEADVIINPSPYEFDGNVGVSAYLNTIYAVIDQSELDLKYADYDEVSSSAEEIPPRALRDVPVFDDGDAPF